jgi:hypothetical protein
VEVDLIAFSFSKDFGGGHFKKTEISLPKTVGPEERHAGLRWAEPGDAAPIAQS